MGRRSEEPGKEILEADLTLSHGPDLSLSLSKEPAVDSKTVVT